MSNPNTNPPKKPLPIINIDDDPQNANWIRILGKRRGDVPPTPTPQEPDDKINGSPHASPKGGSSR